MEAVEQRPFRSAGGFRDQFQRRAEQSNKADAATFRTPETSPTLPAEQGQRTSERNRSAIRSRAPGEVSTGPGQRHSSRLRARDGDAALFDSAAARIGCRRRAMDDHASRFGEFSRRSGINRNTCSPGAAKRDQGTARKRPAERARAAVHLFQPETFQEFGMFVRHTCSAFGMGEKESPADGVLSAPAMSAAGRSRRSVRISP